MYQFAVSLLIIQPLAQLLHTTLPSVCWSYNHWPSCSTKSLRMRVRPGSWHRVMWDIDSSWQLQLGHTFSTDLSMCDSCRLVPQKCDTCFMTQTQNISRTIQYPLRALPVDKWEVLLTCLPLSIMQCLYYLFSSELWDCIFGIPPDSFPRDVNTDFFWQEDTWDKFRKILGINSGRYLG